MDRDISSMLRTRGAVFVRVSLYMRDEVVLWLLILNILKLVM